MPEHADPRLEALRTALAEAAGLDDLAERTLEVVSIVDEAVAPLGIHPIVVGGMAVYFWTENPAFVTVDIDVVMAITAPLSTTLESLGFVKSRDGRHWHLPDTEIFLEAPSSDLDADAVVTKVVLPSGRTARVLSHVDIVLDRLVEFQATGHRIVAQQALVLLSDLTREETADLRTRATRRRVAHALDALARLADEIAAGREPPESDELHQLARAAERAEYTFRRP